MYLELFLWIISFFINISLLALNFYQMLSLSDLEDDYINPYDSSSRINAVVIPEFVLQGVLCGLYLLTWHWFIFLITLPITCYNVMLYMRQQHLIDVTEVFRFIKVEKRKRIAKLAFYMFFFILVVVRILVAGVLPLYSFKSEGLDIRASYLDV